MIDLNSPAYRLCQTKSGLRVISGTLASDSALERTAVIISHVMDSVDPRVSQSMKDKNFRHAVMAAYPRELTTDIPEHSFLDSEFWDERARGLGRCCTVYCTVLYCTVFKGPQSMFQWEALLRRMSCATLMTGK